MLHGTGAETAYKIAKTGFASLSLVDQGFYGKGMLGFMQLTL
jgi:hypothetical protein